MAAIDPPSVDESLGECRAVCHDNKYRLLPAMQIDQQLGDAMRREAQRVIAALTMKLEQVKEPPKVVWVKPHLET